MTPEEIAAINKKIDELVKFHDSYNNSKKMTSPNKEHLKIIDQITGDSPIVLHLSVEETLRCMKILQDEIDSLKVENETLKTIIGKSGSMNIKIEPNSDRISVIDYKLRELKNPKNPD